MTHDGNFNNNKLNTVRIPNVLKSANSIGIPTSTGALIPLQYYKDSKYIYYVDGSITWRAKLTGLLDAEPVNQSQMNIYPTTIYPNEINGYYYSFGNTDNTGTPGATSKIYRAAVATPTSWIDTGSVLSSTNASQTIYVDSNKIWLFGGSNQSATATSYIESANLSTPTVFTSSGTSLPAARRLPALTVVGSTIYMYGGYDASGLATNTIFSASTSAPQTWTNLGGLLPQTLAGSGIYNDGTFIYLLGGLNSNKVYRASVSTPTTFTAITSWVVNGFDQNLLDCQTIVNNGTIYLIAANQGYIYRASTSDLTTWNIPQFNSSPLAGVLPLPAGRKNGNLVIDNINGKAYYLGGINAPPTSVNNINIYVANLSNMAEWSLDSNTLPIATSGGQIIKTNFYYYLFGGNGVTGNVLRAPVATPNVWTLLNNGSNPYEYLGPQATYGRAVFVKDHLFYIGGENPVGTPVSTIRRASIDAGNSDIIVNWSISTGTSTNPLYMSLPIALSRFALIKAGSYIYVLGGTNGSANNTNIYRIHESNIAGNTSTINAQAQWVVVGTLTNPMRDSVVAIINNYAYVIGGRTFSGTPASNIVSYASMTDLANGVANFTEENTSFQIFADSEIMCTDDTLYLVGGTSGNTNAQNTIFKTSSHTIHNLILPKVPESTTSIPTININGALGSLTFFQRTGMHSWLNYSRG